MTGCGVRQDERASIPLAEGEIECVDEFANLGGFDWQNRSTSVYIMYHSVFKGRNLTINISDRCLRLMCYQYCSALWIGPLSPLCRHLRWFTAFSFLHAQLHLHSSGGHKETTV